MWGDPREETKPPQTLPDIRGATAVASAAGQIHAENLRASSHVIRWPAQSWVTLLSSFLPVTKLGSRKGTVPNISQNLNPGLWRLGALVPHPLGYNAPALAQETRAALGSHAKSR